MSGRSQLESLIHSIIMNCSIVFDPIVRLHTFLDHFFYYYYSFSSISAFIAQLCCFCTTSSRISVFSYLSTFFISILSFRLSRAKYIEAGTSFRIGKQAKAKAKAKRMDECKRAVLISCYMQADHILKIAMSRYSCYIFKYTWNTIYIEIWHCPKYRITIRNHRVLMTLYEK